MKGRLLLLLLLPSFLISFSLFGQTPLPLNTIVTENFNAIGSSATATLPANWRMSPAGSSVGAWSAGVNTTTIAASSGLPATGGRYNWATTAGTDRAVGFLSSAAYSSTNAVMAYYRNTTGATASSFTLSYAVERYVVNTGNASVSLASSTDGTTWTLQAGGDITASQFGTGANAGTFTSPETINKTVTVTITVPNNGDVYFRWVFVTDNAASQGLGLDNVSVFAGAATPVVVATLRDLLQVDNGTPNQFNQGDVIRYKTVIKNTGTGDATNVQVTLPTPPANTTMVAGSIKTSAVGVDDNYTASFNTTLNGSTVLVNDIGIPPPTAVLSFGTTADATLYAPGAAGFTDAGGALSVAANGTFTYTPPTGFSGTDQFKYITGNGNLPNNDAIVTLTVAADITFTTTTADPSCNNGTNGSITFTASGGNGTLLYSVTGAAGTYQSSNIFTGLAPGTYNLAVKDAGGLIKTGTATLNNPAAIVVSGTIPQLTYNTAMTTATFTKTGGSGSPANPWLASGLPAGVTINTATGAITGTPTATGTFTATISYTDAGGCTGSKAVTFTVAPNIASETYTTAGNTQLAGGTSPSTPKVSVASLAANDASNATITYALVTGPSQGAVTVNTDGTFTYTPAVGNITSTSFTYSGTSNGIAANATATINFNGKVWYVQAGGAAGDGRSNTPLNTLPSGTLGAPGDFIYVEKEVSGSTTGNLTLQASQSLIGAGVTLNVPTASPVLTITGNSANYPTLTGTLTLANSVVVNGIDMSTGASTALSSSGPTSVSVTIRNATTSGAANAVSLTNTSGSITITGGTLTGGAGTVFNVSGGSATIACSAAITQANAQRIINIASTTGGTIGFSGSITGSGTNTGINLSSNTGATINFTGAITLNGTTSVFTATGGGTVTANATTNTIGNTTAPTITALTITSTTIGPANVTFQKISCSGAANGIFLQNTGTTGGLVVTGDGTNTTKGGNASGGTIQNINGADGTTAGIGIYLNNTANVVLRRMTITGTIQNTGVYGELVKNLTMQYCTVTGTIGTSSGSNDLSLECPVEFGKTSPSIANGFASGSVSTIDNCIINGGIQHNMEVYQQANTASLTISNCNITNNGTTFGSDGINIETHTDNNAGTAAANLTVSVQSCLFDNNKSQALQGSALGDSFLDLTINGCTVQKSSQGNEGFVLQNGTDADMTVHVTNNVFTGILGANIYVGQVAGNASNLSNLIGVIRNNTITVGNASTFPTNRTLIVFLSSTVGQVSTANILVDGNTINTFSDPVNGLSEPLFISTPDANTSPMFTATVTNNTVHITDPGQTAFRGIAVQSTQTTSQGCADVRNNTVTYSAGAGSGISGIRVRQVSPATLNLEQGVSGGTAATVLAANNPASTTQIVGTVNVVSNSGCLTAPTRIALFGTDEKKK